MLAFGLQALGFFFCFLLSFIYGNRTVFLNAVNEGKGRLLPHCFYLENPSSLSFFEVPSILLDSLRQVFTTCNIRLPQCTTTN